jgi:alpha-tubulin suppressor-like RCC1 family protein
MSIYYNVGGKLALSGGKAICSCDISPPYSIMLISAGQYHTTELDNNSKIWSWGYNNYGQLGDNSVTSRRTPVSILGNKKNFYKNSTGESHTVAIDYTGQVWSWGSNSYGRLGDNTVIARSTPVSILGNKKTFCKINAGYSHTVTIDYTGQVWSWGYNNTGQLGDNSVTSKLTPVSILGNKKTFCHIAAGQYHTVAIDYTGQVWSWGYNGYGQLGDNSVTSKNTPVKVCNL